MGLYIGLGVVVLLLLWAVATYNGLVQARNRVKNGWSQVEVVLKNRFDLIPNLVETVKGYAAHEKETLNQVMEARTRFGSAQSVEEKVAASGEVSQVLGRLLMVSEAYPDLKANQNFLYLKEQLSSIEEKIRFARQFYNDTVESYNTAIQRIPANMIAGMGGFKAEPFFQIEEAEKVVPTVKF